MQVNYNSNSRNFAARNAQIRFADNIIRKVNKEFPRLSSTLINDLQCAKLHPNVSAKLFKKISKMRKNSYFEFLMTTSAKDANFYGFIEKMQFVLYSMKENALSCFSKSHQTDDKKVGIIINPIKKLKIGNCMEASYLGLIAARINGLKNVRFVHLVSPDGYLYDHSVVLVNCGKDKKSYVLDGWLGFADYVPNAIKRWQKEFAHHFDFEKANTDKIFLQEHISDMKNLLENVDVEILKKEYPELCMPAKK